MYDIPDDNILTKVHLFKLQRANEMINIEVREILKGSGTPKFEGWPRQAIIDARYIPQEFRCTGDTLEETLNNVIERIKDLPKDQIFRKDEG